MNFCIDCKHFYQTNYEPMKGLVNYCRVAFNPVTGEKLNLIAEKMRTKKSILCGYEGKLFEPVENKN